MTSGMLGDPRGPTHMWGDILDLPGRLKVLVVLISQTPSAVIIIIREDFLSSERL